MMKAARWTQLTKNPARDFRIFQLREDTWGSPNRDYQQNFISIQAPDWVNVVAVTSRLEVVCVRQWRAGTDTVELEIPGGVIDPGDPDAVAAGVRELAEETGYRGQRVELIGQVYANPAIQNNTCYTVFVGGCERVTEQYFDPGEEIEVVILPLSELEGRLLAGAFRHSLVVAAFQHFLLRKSRLIP
jgi:8-oxo-dGTP pyrophosphatase MutT (NUDIX family)